MPAADVASYDLGDLYRQWCANLGVTASSLSVGETLSLIADNAAAQGALGNTDMSPTGTIATNLPRFALTSQTLAVASGTLELQAMYLTKGMVVTNVNWVSGSTAGATLDHQWGLIATPPSTAPVVVASSADATSAAIAANTQITYALTTPYTVPSSGIYYVGVMVHNNAGTQPTFAGNTALPAATNAFAPSLGGSSNTGATTPVAVGTALTTITSVASQIYLYLT